MDRGRRVSHGGGAKGQGRPRRSTAMGADAGPRCPLCAATLFSRHCEYVCPNHGVVYDCSDPFN